MTARLMNLATVVRLATVLAVAAAPALALAGDEAPLGAWQLSVAMDDGSTLEATLNVAKDGDQLSGTLTGQDGQEVSVSDVSFGDGTLKFAMVRDFGGNQLSTQFELKLDGDKVEGTVDYDLAGQTGTLNVTGGRAASAVDPLGTWKLAVTTPDGMALEAAVRITKDGDKLAGNFLSPDGSEVALSAVSLEGSELTAEASVDFGGQSLVTKFKGTISGDEFTGTVDYDLGGQTGTLDVTGKREKIDVLGLWNMLVTTPDGQSLEPQVKITRDGDALAGLFLSPDGSEVPLSNVVLAGDQLTAEATVDFGGQSLVTKFKGTVSGDEFTGTVDYDLAGQTGTLDVTGKRQVPDATGVWVLTVTTPDGQTIEPQVKISKDGDKLTGVFVSIDGTEVPLTVVVVEGNELVAEATVDFGGQSLVTKFKGTVDGDAFNGTVDYDLAGQVGTLDVTGKKAPAAGDNAAAKLVGKWLITITTDDGQTFEPSLELKLDGDKLVGHYSGQAGEAEASELKLEGDQLSFKIVRERDGTSFTATYHGQVKGDAIQGTVEFDFGGQTGSAGFEAKRGN